MNFSEEINEIGAILAGGTSALATIAYSDREGGHEEEVEVVGTTPAGLDIIRKDHSEDFIFMGSIESINV